MATAQRFHPVEKQKKSKVVFFPDTVTSEQESLGLVKRLLAISVSCITYLRGLFPESSYGTRYLDQLCLKILKEDKSCCGSHQVVKWIQGSFDALENKYLRMAVLEFYTNPKDLESVTELYQFKFRYTKEGPNMDFVSSNKINFESGERSKEIKSSILMIRKLYMLMQYLEPLPNDVTLTMKLFYYNDVTPADYQPPGFKDDNNPVSLVFEGDPVNLKVGSVSTGYHTMKVKVTTEIQRMTEMANRLVNQNSTEISHQGLDCDEEEEENAASMDKSSLPIKNHQTKSNMNEGGNENKESASILQQTDYETTRLEKETKQFNIAVVHQTLDFTCSQDESVTLWKRRKVSEPVNPLTANGN
ncbi:HORMA domain-containing protein 2 [Microcaecilia unicolor]|uniref:HORMA domain-containing protein 2 n=1 Tax=Microcaecilia unicolor TaxID=1415580 RepID=A0A6P7Z949_9AMPH|nr:HORMA domain-containing protein 2 [Microcaecilia unicolor]